MKLAVLCPHFSPDPAPTGEVISRVVRELAARGHELHVVSALPWYTHHAVEVEWRGRPVRRERTPWGSITRVHPFPSDKTNLALRALSFGGFCALAGIAALPGGRFDAVLAMSPPLPLGLVGRLVAAVHRCPMVFNVQDIFPDVAVQLGKLTDARLIRAARWLERSTYEHAAAITVLSTDLQANVVSKVRTDHRGAVRVIPNFVDTELVRPLDRHTGYRHELQIADDQIVVLYAGNVGFSQSLDLLTHAARHFASRRDVVFVVNGGGSGLAELKSSTSGLGNVRYAPYQPRERLAEVLASGDIHIVPLRRGLASSSVPSKTYSILAAGRPLVAAIDEGSEVARVVAMARCGVAIPPDDPGAFVGALSELIDDRAARETMGARGRAWVESWISPAAVAEAYEELFDEVAGRHRPPDRAPHAESAPRVPHSAR
jgi:putative colanic acid biosynthesis glycosyltransferase WcaI